MQELTATEIAMVNGGAVSDDAVYGASLAAAGGFLVTAIACAAALTPVGMGILVGASIISSANAIYTVSQ